MSPSREELPHRRSHEVFAFEHLGQVYTVGVGRYADGRLAELFLNCGKSGTQIQTHARDSAVLLSLLLQRGGSIDEARHALTRNPDNSATGAIGALLDLLAADAAAAAATEPEAQP